MTTDRYQQAGVNIDAANHLVEDIKKIARKTHCPHVLAGIGGFAALYELPLDQYRKPVLVSSTDGVGTKLKLALELKNHEGIGIDLVAMCVNDLIVTGAKPLFFLDYYATGKLDTHVARDVIASIGRGCELAGASLIGGETAEMPGMYSKDEYDLAGFCVGVVDKDRIIDGSQVAPGHQLIGIGSSGVHSNGYSLVRHILSEKKIPLSLSFGDTTLGNTLLEPTKIYVKTIFALLEQFPIHAIAHITGGGITENLPRVLPTNTKAKINAKSWKRPAIFEWLEQEGSLSQAEMLRTFNNGIGLILCVPASVVNECLQQLKQLGENAWHIGAIVRSDQSTPEVSYDV